MIWDAKQMGKFEIIYLIGFIVATVIRSYYGFQFKRKEIVHSQKETPIVFIGIALWSVVLMLPFISLFSDVLAMADYQIIISLRVVGAIIFIGGLWVLWKSHSDLASNFSPSLFIRKNHTLKANPIFRWVRHPPCRPGPARDKPRPILHR